MEDNRRLSDLIVGAHKRACEDGKLEVADVLLRALEVDLSAIGGDQTEQRQSTKMMEEAFERHDKAKQKF